MTRLIFKAADVRRVIEHSLTSPEQTPVAYQGTPVAKPAVILVHDSGVYLMSNGSPRDILNPGQYPSIASAKETGHSFCAYAEGCNPTDDADWYDTARAMVGGDDFAQTLEWANEIKAGLDQGATHVVLNFTETRISLTFKKPRRKAA